MNYITILIPNPRASKDFPLLRVVIPSQYLLRCLESQRRQIITCKPIHRIGIISRDQFTANDFGMIDDDEIRAAFMLFA